MYISWKQFKGNNLNKERIELIKSTEGFNYLYSFINELSIMSINVFSDSFVCFFLNNSGDNKISKTKPIVTCNNYIE